MYRGLILRLLFPCGSSNLGLGIHQCFKRTVLAKVGNAMHHSMRTHFQELRILPSYLGYAVWSRPIMGSLLDLLDLLRMCAEAAGSKWIQSSSMWEFRSCRILWCEVKMYEAMHCKICKCLKNMLTNDPPITRIIIITCLYISFFVCEQLVCHAHCLRHKHPDCDICNNPTPLIINADGTSTYGSPHPIPAFPPPPAS